VASLAAFDSCETKRSPPIASPKRSRQTPECSHQGPPYRHREIEFSSPDNAASATTRRHIIHKNAAARKPLAECQATARLD